MPILRGLAMELIKLAKILLIDGDALLAQMHHARVVVLQLKQKQISVVLNEELGTMESSRMHNLLS